MASKPPKILVVDDEPDMCWALENILSSSGFAVTTTTSSTKAVKLVGRETYPVAFVDAKLPDLDGQELALLIHQISPLTAVILISGYFYSEDKVIIQGLKNGNFIGFVAKPFQVEEIRSMARQAMKRVKDVSDVPDPYFISR